MLKPAPDKSNSHRAQVVAHLREAADMLEQDGDIEVILIENRYRRISETMGVPDISVSTLCLTDVMTLLFRFVHCAMQAPPQALPGFTAALADAIEVAKGKLRQANKHRAGLN